MANLGPASSMASVFGGAITDLGEAVPDRDLAGPQSLVLSSHKIAPFASSLTLASDVVLHLRRVRLRAVGEGSG
jgi:hypothetical protein